MKINATNCCAITSLVKVFGIRTCIMNALRVETLVVVNNWNRKTNIHYPSIIQSNSHNGTRRRLYLNPQNVKRTFAQIIELFHYIKHLRTYVCD